MQSWHSLNLLLAAECPTAGLKFIIIGSCYSGPFITSKLSLMNSIRTPVAPINPLETRDSGPWEFFFRFTDSRSTFLRVYYNAGVYFVPSLAMMSLLPAVGIAPPGSTWALMQDTILATVSRQHSSLSCSEPPGPLPFVCSSSSDTGWGVPLLTWIFNQESKSQVLCSH